MIDVATHQVVGARDVTATATARALPVHAAVDRVHPFVDGEPAELAADEVEGRRYAISLLVVFVCLVDGARVALA